MPETGLRSNKGHKDAPSDKREKSFRFHRYTRFKFRPTDFPIPTRCAPATTSGFPCAATNRTCRSTDRYPEPAFILLARALSLDSACSIFCFLLFFVLMTFFYSPGRTPTLSSACIQSLHGRPFEKQDFGRENRPRFAAVFSRPNSPRSCYNKKV